MVQLACFDRPAYRETGQKAHVTTTLEHLDDGDVNRLQDLHKEVAA